jgi:hypothetical protein
MEMCRLAADRCFDVDPETLCGNIAGIIGSKVQLDINVLES